MTDRQLELGFNKENCRGSVARQRRLSRASWWFARMRQVVSCAKGSKPTLAAPAEQICFAHAFRRPGLETVNRVRLAEARATVCD